MAQLAIWVGFLTFIFALLALDLGVFHRKAHAISVREALGWTAVWVSTAMLFNVLVYFIYQHNWLGLPPENELHGKGLEAARKFFLGYVIEESLSVDNIFVIATIMAFFCVPAAHQHRLLFWGIMGAVVLRGVMIGIGAALIKQFSWIMYGFGALLIFSAVKMLLAKEEDIHPDRNLLVRLTRMFFPVTSEYHGSHFFVRLANGRLAATPMFMALVLVESCDVMFAVDSIPAIFGVTTDPFLIFTSNVFAILGLRSLFFAVAGLMDMFQYLKVSLVFLLTYIGVKMLLHDTYKIDDLVSLAIIGGILFVGIAASVIANTLNRKEEVRPPVEESPTPAPAGRKPDLEL